MVFRFDNALKKIPRDPAPFDVAGNARLALGKSEDALSTFRALLPAFRAGLAPDLAMAHTGPARACPAQIGPDNPQRPAVDEATQAVSRAQFPVAPEPENPVLRKSLAWVLARQEALASETVERVGTLEPACNKAADRPDIGYHDVPALAAAGRNGEALSVLHRVKDWDATFTERNQAQSLLQYLGG